MTYFTALDRCGEMERQTYAKKNIRFAALSAMLREHSHLELDLISCCVPGRFLLPSGSATSRRGLLTLPSILSGFIE